MVLMGVVEVETAMVEMEVVAELLEQEEQVRVELVLMEVLVAEAVKVVMIMEVHVPAVIILVLLELLVQLVQEAEELAEVGELEAAVQIVTVIHRVEAMAPLARQVQMAQPEE